MYVFIPAVCGWICSADDDDDAHDDDRDDDGALYCIVKNSREMNALDEPFSCFPNNQMITGSAGSCQIAWEKMNSFVYLLFLFNLFDSGIVSNFVFVMVLLRKI